MPQTEIDDMRNVITDMNNVIEDALSCESDSLTGGPNRRKTAVQIDVPSGSESKQSSDVVEDTSSSSRGASDYITMSGTIARGRCKGKSIDVLVNISRDELEKLEAGMIVSSKKRRTFCSKSSGLHIFLFTLATSPPSFFISTMYSFLYGTFTWYNIFQYFTESHPLWILRVIMTPLLIVLYPFAIVALSLGLGLYAMLCQISWHWEGWWKEFSDFEKGFYGWFCGVVHLSDCAPYEVVVLSAPNVDKELV